MCIDCGSDIILNAPGSDGWSPILALYEGECDGDAVTVHQLVSWQEGSGNRPNYNGNIMTDQWLIDNPIYLGSAGFVTDICEAVPLNGGAGSAGAAGGTGPEGPEGPAGCAPIADLNFEFTNNGEPLTPAVDVAVTVDDTEPCNPIYDISIDASDLFTNPDLINVLLATTTFQNYIDDIVAASIGGVNGITYLEASDLGKTGDPLVLYKDADTLMPGVTVLNFVASRDNVFKWNIIGNRMTFDFLLNIETDNTSEQDCILQLQIPAGKTVSSEVYPESNAVAVTIGEYEIGTYNALTYTEALQGTPVITTYEAYEGSNYLLLGVTPSAKSVSSDRLYGFNFRGDGYAYRIQGQLTFTINT